MRRVPEEAVFETTASVSWGPAFLRGLVDDRDFDGQRLEARVGIEPAYAALQAAA